jgi:ABC-type polar amino acid transport system ATPase subunit
MPRAMRNPFDRIGPADRTRACPTSCRVGQQQRVAIVRAVAIAAAAAPPDEPTSHSIQNWFGEVLEVMIHLAEDCMARAIATDEMGFVREAADTRGRWKNCRTRCSGRRSDSSAHPTTQAFLVRVAP